MIRPATHADCDALSRLAFRSKAHWGYSPEFMAQCRAELSIGVDAVDEDEIYVLEADDGKGLIEGFYSLERSSERRVELGHFFVDPDAMGRGHGRRMMDHAVAAARALGFDTLEIQADPNAEAFYSRCGARTVGQRASASVADRSLPLMELALTR